MVGWVTVSCEPSPFRRRLAIRRGLISADFTMVSLPEYEVALGLPLGAPMPTLPGRARAQFHDSPSRLAQAAGWTTSRSAAAQPDETVTMQVGEGLAVTVEKP
jgi:hypothetical protein